MQRKEQPAPKSSPARSEAKPAAPVAPAAAGQLASA